ncbi:MAG: hypothetical protein WC091_22925 [Sulfuricellaceae bacterium]
MSQSGQYKNDPINVHLFFIHRWAVGRPALVASFAQQAVTTIPVIQGLVGMIRSGQAARVINGRSGTADWLYLYRSPRAFKEVLIREFQTDPDLRECAFLLDFFAKRLPNMGEINTEVLDHAPPEAIAIAEEMIRQLALRMYQQSLSQIAEQLRGEDEEREIPIGKLMHLPEMQFFALVVLPCLIEYGEMPNRLYANARRGDRQALQDLLRVDKSIIGDRDLGPMIQQAGMESEEFFADGLADAFRGRPKTKQEAGIIKARIAAYLVKFSEGSGCKLDPKDIRHLFDAVEKDRTDDPNAIDTDLPEYDENWRQAVYRAKPFWANRLKRDFFSLPERYAHFILDVVVSEEDEPAPEPTWINPYWGDDFKEARDQAKRGRGPKPSKLRRLVDSLFGR